MLPVFFFTGSEDGEYQPPPAKWPMVHADADLNQNAFSRR